MPSLINNGPVIPDKLLQLHQDGKIVFFCGAGISYPASLPGFEGLVDRLYKALGTSSMSVEELAKDAKQFDRVIQGMSHLLLKLRGSSVRLVG